MSFGLRHCYGYKSRRYRTSSLHSTNKNTRTKHTKHRLNNHQWCAAMGTRNSYLLPLLFLLNLSLFLTTTSFAFKSDELLLDDEEFGLEGGRSPDLPTVTPPLSPSPSTRKRSVDSGSDPDSKIQFSLEHAFGDSDFSPAGTFSARLKTSSHGGQVLQHLLHQ